VNRLRRYALSLSFVIALAATAAAATMTPFDVMKIRSVSSAVISPDGTRIAYTLTVPRNILEKDDDGSPFSELHVVDSTGASRAFITGEVGIGGVRWTADSRTLSFLAKRGKDEFRSLYLIDITGGEARRVLTHETDISEYSWSPDGKRVAFTATEADAKKKKDLVKKGFTQIIFEENAKPLRIWIATIGVDESRKPLAVEGSVTDLQWSPTGSLLAFTLAPTSLVDQSYTSRKVTVADANSGAIIGRVQNPGKLGNLAWSPDGKSLAFISSADEHDDAAGRLMITAATGGAMRELVPNYQGHVSDLAWSSPNTIFYSGDEGVWTTVGEVSMTGTKRQSLVASGSIGVNAFDLSRDGKSAALIVDSPQHPPEVYFWQRGSAAPKRLTHSNAWLGALPLAKQEVVRYRARDGVEVEGVLIRPLNEQRGKRYPLIIVVHGGPEAHYRNGWLTGYSNPGQVAAARGFAVFYPNYRGSTGRGVEFTKMSFKDPAGKEFDDLVDAITHFVGTGLVEKSKVGVTGGSYGGYASAWAATKLTEHFAASVMFVGISNLASKWGTTDIPDEEFLVHAGQYPSDDWQFHLERSPVYWARQSRTPTLILHGKEDPRVHPSQSLDLYRNLKQFGKAPVRLVLYPGEGHGNSRAASRLDYNLRMMQWFEHYLQGAGGAAPAYEISYDLPKAEAVTVDPTSAQKQDPQKQEELKKKPDPTTQP